LAPSPPTCAVQQVGSYLRYSSRGANAFGKAARDPFRTCRCRSASGVPLIEINTSCTLRVKLFLPSN